MSPARPVVQSGMFVVSGTGERFRMVSEPAGPERRGTVVFVHAFAEEMNKSRRMAARMARLLAGEGWRVVQRDLRGCGDSSGEFEDASWEDWVRDVQEEVAVAGPEPAWLWCHRAGALLTPAALAVRADLNLLLWQPVLSGAQHLQQFLRLHAGARIVGSAKSDAGPTPMQRLREGMAVEVGGYTIHPTLAAGLEKASFDLPEGFAGRVCWLEVSAAEQPELSPQGMRMVQRLTERGIVVDPQVIGGPPFWMTQEIEDCDALLARTLEGVRRHAPLDARADAAAARA